MLTPPGSTDTTRMVLRSIIFVALIGTIGYVASLYLPRGETTLRASAPDRLAIRAEETTDLPIDLALRNETGEVLSLSTPSRCAIFKWVVFSARGAFVQGMSEDGCIDAPGRLELGPGERAEERIIIALRSRRLQPGEDYVVRLSFWGKTADLTFTATAP